MGPKCIHKCPDRSDIEENLIDMEETVIVARCKVWSDLATDQGILEAARNWKRQETDFSLTPQEGVQHCWNLISDEYTYLRLLVSRILMEWISIITKHQTGGNLLQQSQESTNTIPWPRHFLLFPCWSDWHNLFYIFPYLGPQYSICHQILLILLNTSLSKSYLLLQADSHYLSWAINDFGSGLVE